uniref:Uncharacterized protein n=1 Tax=Kalanchoe fedtschenkoi TaxID=63787 RepID=A0A7N0VHJ6_KALFE
MVATLPPNSNPSRTSDCFSLSKPDNRPSDQQQSNFSRKP